MARPKGSKNKLKEEAPGHDEAPEQHAAQAADGEYNYGQQDLYQYLREADRYAESARESSGQLGQWTSTFIERTGADPWALRQLRTLKRCDAARRTMRIRALLYMLKETNEMPEPDLVDRAEGIELSSRKSPMESKAPPPPQTDEVEEQVRTNVTRLNNIRELKEASTG